MDGWMAGFSFCIFPFWGGSTYRAGPPLSPFCTLNADGQIPVAVVVVITLVRLSLIQGQNPVSATAVGRIEIVCDSASWQPRPASERVQTEGREGRAGAKEEMQEDV
jgi:hypothetical protein